MKLLGKIIAWIKNRAMKRSLPENVYVIKDDLKKWVELYNDDSIYGKIVFWERISKLLPVNPRNSFHSSFISFDPACLIIFEKNKKFRNPESKGDVYKMLEHAVVLNVGRKKKSKVEKNTVVLDVLEKKKPKVKKKKEAA